jgi:hypothetical protein
MRPVLFRRAPNPWITAILLVTLGFRALIPPGFMPSADRPLVLELCRAGLLARMDTAAPSQHPHDASQNEHCPFGAAPNAGLIPATTGLPIAAMLVAAPTIGFQALPVALRADRAHPARGPPRPA